MTTIFSWQKIKKFKKSLKEVDTATIWALTTVLVLAVTKTYIFNSGTLHWLKSSYCTRIHPRFLVGFAVFDQSFVDRCLSFCSFSFGHSRSSIKLFIWLPIWYFQTHFSQQLSSKYVTLLQSLTFYSKKYVTKYFMFVFIHTWRSVFWLVHTWRSVFWHST